MHSAGICGKSHAPVIGTSSHNVRRPRRPERLFLPLQVTAALTSVPWAGPACVMGREPPSTQVGVWGTVFLVLTQEYFFIAFREGAGRGYGAGGGREGNTNQLPPVPTLTGD